MSGLKTKTSKIGGNKITGFFDWLASAVGWVGSLFGLSHYSGNYNNGNGGWRITWNTNAGGGNDGNGGNEQTINNIAPEIYGSYLPGYTFTGASFEVFPISGPSDPNNGSITISASVGYLISVLGITNTDQMDFLAANPSVSNTLADYLQINGLTSDNTAFGQWAISYLTQNQLFSYSIEADLVADLSSIHSPGDVAEFKSLIMLSKDLYDFEKQVNNGPFDFMNDDWLARLRGEAFRLSQLSRNIAQNVKQKIKGQLDAALVTSLKGTAKSIWPQVDGAATYYSAKLSEFNSNADHGVAVLLWEFATGSGEDVWNFNYSQDITEKFISGRVLPEVFSDFYARINDFNLSYNDFKNRTSPLNASLGFSPDHTSIGESINKHLSSNLVQFFVGGATMYYMPSNDDGWVDVSVTNFTSRSSLLLHIGENYSRNASVNQPLGTTQQNFKFKIKIDKTKFH